MVGDGAGASSGCLVGVTGSRDAGGGGLVTNCTDSYSGRWCVRGRGGGGGVGTTVSRAAAGAAWSGSMEAVRPRAAGALVPDAV